MSQGVIGSWCSSRLQNIPAINEGQLLLQTIIGLQREVQRMTTQIHDNITSLENRITGYTREVWEKGALTLQPRRRSLTT